MKALLLIWIHTFQGVAMTSHPLPSMEVCEAVAERIKEHRSDISSACFEVEKVEE